MHVPFVTSDIMTTNVEQIAAKREHEALKSSKQLKQTFERHYDIPYVDLDKVKHTIPSKNMLDIYVPSTDTTIKSTNHGATADLRPVMVFVHGGGWKRFDRRSGFTGMHGNVGEAFAQRGYVSVVISYRLSFILLKDMLLFYTFLSAFIGIVVTAILAPSSDSAHLSVALPLAFLCPLAFGILHIIVERSRGHRGCRSIFSADPVHHPTHCEDAALAVAWVINNIAKYGGDNRRIALMGHSAGGHIVSMLAVQPEFLKRAGVPRAMVDNIRAVVCLSGVYDAELLSGKGLSQLYCCSRAFRRVWFLRPAFGTEESRWLQSFATGLCADEEHARSVPLPPMLLVNASNDLGLNAHTDKFARQLQCANRQVHQIVLQGCNHIDYIMGMGRDGWLGDVVVVPRLLKFFAEHINCDVPRTPDGISLGLETSTGAGAMPKQP